MTTRKPTEPSEAAVAAVRATVAVPEQDSSAAERLSVQAALAAIIGELPGIGKDEQMGTGQYGYKYRGIETITRNVQPLLSKYGVVIIPQSNIHSIVPAFESKNSGWQDTILHVNWTIIGPDGSSLEASTIGIGRDNSDKGANKAQSQAFKYLLLQLLCISDADDDTDGHENRSMQGRETDPIDALFERVVATKGTPMEQALKDLAEFNDKKLSANALREDTDWAEMVAALLNEGETNG